MTPSHLRREKGEKVSYRRYEIYIKLLTLNKKMRRSNEIASRWHFHWTPRKNNIIELIEQDNDSPHGFR